MWRCTNLDAFLTAALFVRFNDELSRRRLALCIVLLVLYLGEAKQMEFLIFRLYLALLLFIEGRGGQECFVCYVGVFFIWGCGYRSILDKRFSGVFFGGGGVFLIQVMGKRANFEISQAVKKNLRISTTHGERIYRQQLEVILQLFIFCQ